MKNKKNWPAYILQTLELLESIWQPDEIWKEAQPLAHYLKQHRDPLLQAHFDMLLYQYYIVTKQRKHIENAFAHIEQLNLGAKSNYLNGLYNYNKAKWSFMHREASGSLQHIESALQAFSALGDKKREALCKIQLYNTCITFTISLNYEPIELAWDVINICNELGLTDDVIQHLYGTSCGIVASYYILEEKNASAVDFLQEPYRQLSNIDSPHVHHLKFLMATALMFDKKFEPALQLFLEVYNSDSLKYTTLTPMHIAQYIAACAMELNTLPDYIDYYNLFVNEASKSELAHNILQVLCFKSVKAALEKNAPAALINLKEAKEHLIKHNMTDPFRRLYYDTASQAYQLLGDYKAALENYKQSEQYMLKNQSSITAKKIELLENKVKMANQAKENDLLKMELAHHARELELTATFLKRKNDLVEDILTFTNTVGKKHKNQSGIFEIKKKLISIKSEDTERDKLKELLDKNNQAYIKKITSQYPSITNAEAKICALIKVGLGNKEIASLLVTSLRTVDTHRSNIRRKLALNKAQNLETVLRNL